MTHFIEILLVPEFQLTKFIIGAFSYKAHFRPQISSNEGIILVDDWEGMPYNIFCCHQGFTSWHRLKDEEEKQLPADNGGLEILCSPRSRDFRHGSLRYVGLFLIPICLPLFDVCDVCCCCYLHLPHQIVDVIVTSECIHLYILCIVPRCLFWEVIVM